MRGSSIILSHSTSTLSGYWSQQTLEVYNFPNNEFVINTLAYGNLILSDVLIAHYCSPTRNKGSIISQNSLGKQGKQEVWSCYKSHVTSA